MFIFILPILLLTSLASGVLVFVLTFASPTNADGSLIIVNLAYFFTALFISLAGLATLVLYWLGSLRLKMEGRRTIEAVHKPKQILLKSLRHGLVASVAVCGIALLNVLNLSNGLNIILIISAAIILEVYF